MADGLYQTSDRDMVGMAPVAPPATRRGDGRHEPIVIYAPLRRDGPALTELLSADGLDAHLCETEAGFAEALRGPVAAIIFTQESFTPDIMASLRPWLEAQEGWSDPPVIALLDPRQHGRSRAAHLSEILPNSTILILERPVRAMEFLSAVRASLQTRRRQLQLRDQLVLQEDLLRELSHRVKNALANVYAVYRMTFRHSADLPSFGQVFEARLQALSRVHQMLATTSWQGADVAVMTREALAPYADGRPVDDLRTAAGDGREARIDAPKPARISLDGPKIPLVPRQALTLALTVHELATNAAKYGALSTPDGRVAARWSLEASDGRERFRLEWREAGGPPVAAPTREGFGTSFVRAAFAAEPEGEVRFVFDPDGLACHLAFTREAPPAGDW